MGLRATVYAFYKSPNGATSSRLGSAQPKNAKTPVSPERAGSCQVCRIPPFFNRALPYLEDVAPLGLLYRALPYLEDVAPLGLLYRALPYLEDVAPLGLRFASIFPHCFCHRLGMCKQ